MAVIIGKAAIKVYPDTKRFREETLAKLKKELAGLDKDVNEQQRLQVKAEVVVDEKKSAKNFKAFTDKMQGQTVTVRVDVDIDQKFEHLDNYLDEMRRRAERASVVVQPEFDADHFNSALSDMARDTDRASREAAESVGQIDDSFDDITESIDRTARRSTRFFDEFGNDLRDVVQDSGATRYVWEDFALRAEDSFEKVGRRYQELMDDLERQGQVRDLEMGLDMTELERDLQVLHKRLREIEDEYDDTDLEFHPVLDETSYRAVWARLKWLTRDRIAMIHPIVNKGAAALAERTLKAITLNASGLRNAGRALKNFFEYLERLDKNAPVLGMIATGIAAIGGAAIAAVGTVSHLAVEFTRMAGAGLALPGILGGFAVGIGVMVAALQDFNREIPKVREDLGRMQDMISDRFWQQAKVPLLDAWNKMLPSLEDGFNRTAEALGGWTAAMAEGLSSNLSTESMSHMFENLAESIDIAAESGDDFGRIIEVLGKRGSEYLPRLAQWGNDVMASFRGWLDEADRTGALNDMIETGITKLKEFGVLVRESGELIYLLGSAAERAGFSGLKEMSEGLEQVNEDLKRNQDSLDDYFSGAANIADGFKSLLGSITDGLGEFSGTFEHISGDVRNVLEDIGDALETVLGNEKFQQGVEDLFGGISSAVEDLSGQAPVIADVLGSVASLVGEVLENIGDVGAEFIDAFGPTVADVISDLEGDIGDLGGALSDLVDTMSEAESGDSSLIESLGDLVSLAASKLMETATEWLGHLSEALEGLQRVLNGDWGGLGQMFRGLINMVTMPLQNFWSTLQGLLNFDGFWIFDDWAGGIIDGIGTAFETIGRGVSTAMGWLVTEIGNALDFDGLFAFDDWFPDIAKNVSEWWNKQMSDISAIFSGIGAFFEGIGRWVSETMGAFFEWLGELFSGEGGGSNVANIGMGIVNWFDFSAVIPAIQAKWDELKTGVQTAWDTFWSWLTGLFENPESGEFDFFGTIQRWLGLENVTLEGLFDSAKEALQNAWDTFWSWVGGLFGGGEGGSGGGGGGFDIDFRLNALDNASAVVAQVGATMQAWASNIYQAALTAIDWTRNVISTAKNNLVTWAQGRYQAALTAINRTQAVINTAKERLVTWARGKYQAALTAINKTQATINTAKSRITAWARSKYEAALTAANNTGTGISRAVSAIRSRVVNATFRAKVTMSNVVSGLSNVVSKIRNAVSNFTARVRTQFNNNNGNVFDRVQAFANGGITSMTGGGSDPRMRYAWENHTAQIAPAGAMRLWAEPETGGEAYIPLSPAKRARSTAILSDVADRFGYKLQQFNNGSEAPRGGDTSYGGNNYTVNVQTLRPDVASEVTGDVMFHLKHLAYGGGRQHGF